MRKGFTLVELLVAIAIIGILAAILVGGISSCSVSDGSRVGTITKFSHKGITSVTKSYEGELLMGGLRAGLNGNSVANVWAFTVTDSDMIDKIQKAMDTGTPVKIMYHQNLVRIPWRSDTRYFVEKVEPIDPNKYK